MTDDSRREFGSRTEPFTEEKLAEARKTLAKLQGMDWRSDYPGTGTNGKHKAPCLPVNDVEWLFGYIDHLQDERDYWRRTTEERQEQ